MMSHIMRGDARVLCKLISCYLRSLLTVILSSGAHEPARQWRRRLARLCAEGEHPPSMLARPRVPTI